MVRRNLIAAMELVTDGHIDQRSAHCRTKLVRTMRGAFFFGTPVLRTIGATGEYLTSMQWNRLGLARDRVYGCPGRSNENGA